MKKSWLFIISGLALVLSTILQYDHWEQLLVLGIFVFLMGLIVRDFKEYSKPEVEEEIEDEN